MGKIKILIFPWISYTINVNSNNEIIIEIQNEKKMTVKDVLYDLSMNYPLFGEKVFDVKNQKLAADVNLLLNGNIILSENGMDAELNDGDLLTIWTLAVGG